jgi:hypothetical protein
MLVTKRAKRELLVTCDDRRSSFQLISCRTEARSLFIRKSELVLTAKRSQEERARPYKTVQICDPSRSRGEFFKRAFTPTRRARTYAMVASSSVGAYTKVGYHASLKKTGLRSQPYDFWIYVQLQLLNSLPCT